MPINKVKNDQILLTLPKLTVKAIEQYQLKNNIKTRSEAIRILINASLETDD